MKWRSRSRTAKPRQKFIRPAEMIIDEVIASLVAEQLDEVTRCEVSLSIARRRLAEAKADQLAWRRDGTFDHVLGVRALLMAQISDLDRRTDPPGANLAGMLAFLKEDHPPRLPDESTADAPVAGLGTGKAEER